MSHLRTHLDTSVDVVLDEAPQRLPVRRHEVLLVSEGQKVCLGLRQLVLRGAKKDEKRREKAGTFNSMYVLTKKSKTTTPATKA